MGWFEMVFMAAAVPDRVLVCPKRESVAHLRRVSMSFNNEDR